MSNWFLIIFQLQIPYIVPYSFTLIHSTDFFLKYLFAPSTYCTAENKTNTFQFIIMQLFCNDLDFKLLVTDLYLFWTLLPVPNYATALSLIHKSISPPRFIRTSDVGPHLSWNCFYGLEMSQDTWFSWSWLEPVYIEDSSKWGELMGQIKARISWGEPGRAEDPEDNLLVQRGWNKKSVNREQSEELEELL